LQFALVYIPSGKMLEGSTIFRYYDENSS